MAVKKPKESLSEHLLNRAISIWVYLDGEVKESHEDPGITPKIKGSCLEEAKQTTFW